jgi:hypothetical protein
MRTRGQVVDDRRGGVLHDHEAGLGAVLVADQEGGQSVVGRRIDQFVEPALADRRQHRDRGLDRAHRQRQRHAVEVAGGDDLLLDVLGLLVGEHQRVVGDGIELDPEHALGVLDGITHRTVDLRHAAQRITVLRLVLLAAAERLEAVVELLATMALVAGYPVPADVETQPARGVGVPARRQPRAEPRHQVVGNVGQRRPVEQFAQPLLEQLAYRPPDEAASAEGVAAPD